MKKYILLIIMVLAVLTSLVGCGKDENGESTSKGETVTENANWFEGKKVANDALNYPVFYKEYLDKYFGNNWTVTKTKTDDILFGEVDNQLKYFENELETKDYSRWTIDVTIGDEVYTTSMTNHDIINYVIYGHDNEYYSGIRSIEEDVKGEIFDVVLDIANQKLINEIKKLYFTGEFYEECFDASISHMSTVEYALNTEAVKASEKMLLKEDWFNVEDVTLKSIAASEFGEKTYMLIIPSIQLYQAKLADLYDEEKFLKDAHEAEKYLLEYLGEFADISYDVEFHGKSGMSKDELYEKAYDNGVEVSSYLSIK